MPVAAHPEARILLVDDQEGNLRMLDCMLKYGGYRACRSLQDSRQTVAVYQEFQPDLILLDMMMPYLDGVAVMEQLRPLTEGAYLPVLVLTADTAPATRRRALAAGAHDFMTKPLDVVDLLRRINSLLGQRFRHPGLGRAADGRVTAPPPHHAPAPPSYAG
jgi:putative two-component system response regulator